MLEKKELIKEAENAIEWIREYVKNSGAKGVVVGNSGGKDSAVVIAMATKALGKERVFTVSMPCQSIESDYDDAKAVADAFEVSFIKVDLTECYLKFENEVNNKIKSVISEDLSKESTINVKPRLRMTTLYSIAQTMNYLVIGTGNLCEAMVGYTTK